MAANKIGLTKLGLKKNTNLINLEWNGQIIEIKEYLPIEEKLKLVERVVNQSIDDNNFINPARYKIHIILEVMYIYTNINFTDKQKEDFQGLYDLLVSSGLWEKVSEALNNTSTKELDIIYETVQAIIDGIYKYKNSALGILDAVSADYSNLNLDAENIQKNLADPDNLTLLKDVVTKLG